MSRECLISRLEKSWKPQVLAVFRQQISPSLYLRRCSGRFFGCQLWSFAFIASCCTFLYCHQQYLVSSCSQNITYKTSCSPHRFVHSIVNVLPMPIQCLPTLIKGWSNVWTPWQLPCKLLGDSIQHLMLLSTYFSSGLYMAAAKSCMCQFIIMHVQLFSA
jgi:hypothetical protein